MRKYKYSIIAIILVLLIVIYFQKNNNYLNRDYVRVECFDSNEKNISNIEIRDVVICNILYQNNDNIDTISYLLDYGSGMDIISDEKFDNYYIDIRNLNNKLKIKFMINENANCTNLYIALRNIKVIVKNSEYLIKNDYVYNLRKYYKKI